MLKPMADAVNNLKTNKNFNVRITCGGLMVELRPQRKKTFRAELRLFHKRHQFIRKII